VDLTYDPQTEGFRVELREWLATNLPEEWQQPGYWERADPDEGFRRRRDWEAAKARAGYAGIEWPVEYGGRGGTPAMRAV
jgi:alkylation response protein AidB-like acyl-CoA dehydrogenase